MRRLTSILTVMILIAGLLAGCSSNKEQSQPQSPSNQNQQATTYPLTIVDDAKTKVTIPAKPQRIVSLLPSSTEILCALGQEPNLIAVSQWDNYPTDIQKKVEFIFADSLNPNLEQLINLQPDLIMFWQTSQVSIDKIRALGIPVVVLDSQSIAQTYEAIEKVGQITDSTQQASRLIAQMKAKEEEIQAKLAQLSPQRKSKVWLEVDSQLYTAGSGTFLNEIMTKAGGQNIAKGIQGWGQFNSEQVIEQNPEIIIVTYSYVDKDAIQKIKTRKGWQNIEAVKNNQVIDIDNDIISRPGPRIIDGLELMAQAIYPELFK